MSKRNWRASIPRWMRERKPPPHPQAFRQCVDWKKALGLGKEKEASRLRAMQLYPAADLRRKRDHGRAEALLLAHYGQRLGC